MERWVGGVRNPLFAGRASGQTPIARCDLRVHLERTRDQRSLSEDLRILRIFLIFCASLKKKEIASGNFVRRNAMEPPAVTARAHGSSVTVGEKIKAYEKMERGPYAKGGLSVFSPVLLFLFNGAAIAYVRPYLRAHPSVDACKSLSFAAWFGRMGSAPGSHPLLCHAKLHNCSVHYAKVCPAPPDGTSSLTRSVCVYSGLMRIFLVDTIDAGFLPSSFLSSQPIEIANNLAVFMISGTHGQDVTGSVTSSRVKGTSERFQAPNGIHHSGNQLPNPRQSVFLGCVSSVLTLPNKSQESTTAIAVCDRCEPTRHSRRKRGRVLVADQGSYFPNSRCQRRPFNPDFILVTATLPRNHSRAASEVWQIDHKHTGLRHGSGGWDE
nr:hypothetical protein Iba_chr01bCG10420 [Ipomoea batatas]